MNRHPSSVRGALVTSNPANDASIIGKFGIGMVGEDGTLTSGILRTLRRRSSLPKRKLAAPLRQWISSAADRTKLPRAPPLAQRGQLATPFRLQIGSVKIIPIFVIGRVVKRGCEIGIFPSVDRNVWIFHRHVGRIVPRLLVRKVGTNPIIASGNTLTTSGEWGKSFSED